MSRRYSADHALFDLVEKDERTHVLMPNMAYACGLTPLDGGHFQVGISDWSKIDCRDCQAWGETGIKLRIAEQQAGP